MVEEIETDSTKTEDMIKKLQILAVLYKQPGVTPDNLVKLSKEIDKILGTDLQDEDVDSAEDWEDNYRAEKL